MAFYGWYVFFVAGDGLTPALCREYSDLVLKGGGKVLEDSDLLETSIQNGTLTHIVVGPRATGSSVLAKLCLDWNSFSKSTDSLPRLVSYEYLRKYSDTWVMYGSGVLDAALEESWLDASSLRSAVHTSQTIRKRAFAEIENDDSVVVLHEEAMVERIVGETRAIESALQTPSALVQNWESVFSLISAENYPFSDKYKSASKIAPPSQYMRPISVLEENPNQWFYSRGTSEQEKEFKKTFLCEEKMKGKLADSKRDCKFMKSLVSMTPESLGSCYLMYFSPASMTPDNKIIQHADDSGSCKLLFLDMDFTIIRPDNRAKFCVGESDWIPSFGHDHFDRSDTTAQHVIRDLLQAKIDDGFRLFILSNQLGISKGTTCLETVKNRILNVVTWLNLPCHVAFAVGDDCYRKPRTGMAWIAQSVMIKRVPQTDGAIDTEIVPIDWRRSVFVGDAAGRQASKSELRFPDAKKRRVGESPVASPTTELERRCDASSEQCFLRSIEHIHRKYDLPSKGIEFISDRIKDFSHADLAFALNMSMLFTTPQAFFGGSQNPEDKNPVLYCSDLLDSSFKKWHQSRSDRHIVFPWIPAIHLPRPGESIVCAGPDMSKIFDDSTDSNPSIILVVGPPACGKSSLAWKYASQSAAYEIINQDTLKTKEKCVSVATLCLKEKKSVIIDATNVDDLVRNTWTELGSKLKVPVKYVAYDPSEETQNLRHLCLHLNTLRGVNPLVDMNNTKTNRRVPVIALYSLLKRYSPPPPTSDDGITGRAQEKGISMCSWIRFVPGPYCEGSALSTSSEQNENRCEGCSFMHSMLCSFL